MNKLGGERFISGERTQGARGTGRVNKITKTTTTTWKESLKIGDGENLKWDQCNLRLEKSKNRGKQEINNCL